MGIVVMIGGGNAIDTDDWGKAGLYHGMGTVAGSLVAAKTMLSVGVNCARSDSVV